ncbi:FmdB family zinc ribbon protein [Acidihalobacter yilgarnensis]|uniref:FmdB family zinc ribbon protein n=1 Tax=Acidihalobacter yilgarnensis TaxID=2819280 RepID=UPI0009F4A026
MPLYDYACPSCGEFSEFAAINRSAEPASCPMCGGSASRVIGAPALALMSSALRQAHTRSEKSAHAPARTSTRGCGCHGSHTCNSAVVKRVNDTRISRGGTAGSQMKTGAAGARPWMLGH